MNVPNTPDWQKLFGIEDFKPVFDQARDEDPSYDDEGGMRHAIVGATERLEIKIKHGENAAGAFDAVHEHLRSKSRAGNAIDGEVHIRWYDRFGRAEAYEARAIVEWVPDGGANRARDTVSVVFHVQGQAAQITNPTASTLPVVSGLSPANGSTASGDLVTVKGAKFSGATAVKFGAANAEDFTVVDDTRIVAVSPAQAAGSVAVTVTTFGETSTDTVNDDFLYA